MHINELLTLDAIIYDAEAASKKIVLEIISETAHSFLPSLSQHEIFDKFIEREQLGSTAIGSGVALPHARVKNNDKTIGVFISLKQAIDFRALDGDKVKYFFALLIPEGSTQEHLNVLAALAKFFRNEENRKKLNNSSSKQELYDLLCKIEQ